MSATDDLYDMFPKVPVVPFADASASHEQIVANVLHHYINSSEPPQKIAVIIPAPDQTHALYLALFQRFGLAEIDSLAYLRWIKLRNETIIYLLCENTVETMRGFMVDAVFFVGPNMETYAGLSVQTEVAIPLLEIPGTKLCILTKDVTQRMQVSG